MRKRNIPAICILIMQEYTHHRIIRVNSILTDPAKTGGCSTSFEKMHIENKNYITEKEWEHMVKLAKETYPDYNWEKGGYGDYEQFDFVRR